MPPGAWYARSAPLPPLIDGLGRVAGDAEALTVRPTHVLATGRERHDVIGALGRRVQLAALDAAAMFAVLAVAALAAVGKLPQPGTREGCPFPGVATGTGRGPFVDRTARAARQRGATRRRTRPEWCTRYDAPTLLSRAWTLRLEQACRFDALALLLHRDSRGKRAAVALDQGTIGYPQQRGDRDMVGPFEKTLRRRCGLHLLRQRCDESFEDRLQERLRSNGAFFLEDLHTTGRLHRRSGVSLETGLEQAYLLLSFYEGPLVDRLTSQ
jgi:hypothetical protein